MSCKYNNKKVGLVVINSRSSRQINNEVEINNDFKETMLTPNVLSAINYLQEEKKLKIIILNVSKRTEHDSMDCSGKNIFKRMFPLIDNEKSNRNEEVFVENIIKIIKEFENEKRNSLEKQKKEQVIQEEKKKEILKLDYEKLIMEQLEKFIPTEEQKINDKNKNLDFNVDFYNHYNKNLSNENLKDYYLFSKIERLKNPSELPEELIQKYSRDLLNIFNLKNNILNMINNSFHINKKKLEESFITITNYNIKIEEIEKICKEKLEENKNMFFEKFETQKKITLLHNENMEKALKEYNENKEKALKEYKSNFEINESTCAHKIQENDKIISKNLNNIEDLKNILNQLKDKYYDEKEKINLLLMNNFNKENEINRLITNLENLYSDMEFILFSNKGKQISK